MPGRSAILLAALLSALLAVLLPTSGAFAQTPPGFGQAWDSLVSSHRATLEAAGIVGATIAIVSDGEVIGIDYFGLEDLESGRPVDERTLYHWASVTKTFTAVAVMQLRDRGLLDLDDAIVDYVPELRGVHNPFGSMEDVTVRHLLSHSAGLRNSTFPWDRGLEWQPFEPTEWSQLVAMIPYTEILFEPGSRYSYSNPGPVFLGRAIELLTGDVFEAHVRKNLFDPLGMESAYFDLTPWHLLNDRSNSYEMREGAPVARGLDFNTGITVANSGLNATVADLARWIGFLTDAPSTREAVHEAVLAADSRAEMWEAVVAVPDSSSAGRHSHMGLGFFLYDAGGRRLAGHTGTQHAFRSLIRFDPVADVGFIAVYNTAGGDEASDPGTETILLEAIDRAEKELFPLFW